MDIATMNCIDNCAPCCAKPPGGIARSNASKPCLTVLFTPFSTDHHPKLLCRSTPFFLFPPSLTASNTHLLLHLRTYLRTGTHVQVLTPLAGLIGSRRRSRRRISGQSITQPTNLYNSLYFYRYHLQFSSARANVTPPFRVTRYVDSYEAQSCGYTYPRYIGQADIP